jgi:GT2 family glycosyltransferase
MQEDATSNNIGTNNKKSNPYVYIIVLNYNNIFDTIETLNSVYSLSYKNSSLLLVENSSKSEVIEAIRSQYPFLDIIENGKNMGYAEGNNVGIRRAIKMGADYIFVLNNDVILERDVLGRLIASMESLPNSAACQPLVTYFDHQDIIWSEGTEMFFGYPRLFKNGKTIQQIGVHEPPFGLVGCAILFRTDALKKIGLFNETLFLLQEETDWCMRAMNMGFQLLVVNSALVHHKVSVTLGLFSRAYLYYIGRNWLIVGKMNCSQTTYLYILITELLIRIPYYSYQLAKRGQFGMIKFYLRGLVDGIRGIGGEKVL